MRKFSILSILSALALFIVAIQPLYANWGGGTGGSFATGTFKPIGTSQVEMVKEDLHIRLYRDRAKVEIDYLLHNTGDAIGVKAGFPSLCVYDADDKNKPDIEDYLISADGKSIPFTWENGNPAPFRSYYRKKYLDMMTLGEDPSDILMMEWLVSTVHFNRGETRRIHVSYESIYNSGDGGYSVDSDYLDDLFTYLLSTGAAWKGPIQEGRVTIQAVTVNAAKLIITPRGRFQPTKEGFVWEFHNLKPTMADNIVVNLNNHFSTICKDACGDSSGDGSQYSADHGGYYLESHNYTANGISASEEFSAAMVRDYDFDGNTAWRTVHQPGLGETLTLAANPPAHITQIGIIPGCGKDKSEWFSHSRIKSLRVTVNGEYKLTTVLPDEYISFSSSAWKGYQLVNLPAYPENANEIQLTILGVYPGTKDQVTCISEVLLRERLKAKPRIQGIDGKELP
ncbi:MAG: hypothetical protein WAN35_11040 [Terracidiphilus sp.]